MVYFHANQTHYHLNGLAARLVVNQRQTATRKWPIILKKWALCMVLSHGTKFATLDGKRYATASKTKRFQPARGDFSLFWMSLCEACHPAGQNLYHVTVS